MADKSTDKSTDKGTIDLSKVSPKLKGGQVKFTVNKVELRAPSQHMNDDTAIAGSIKNGKIRFSRCLPENKRDYDSLETDAGKLYFGAKFLESLKELVK